jgi:hypothetical protein
MVFSLAGCFTVVKLRGFYLWYYHERGEKKHNQIKPCNRQKVECNDDESDESEDTSEVNSKSCANQHCSNPNCSNTSTQQAECSNTNQNKSSVLDEKPRKKYKKRNH